MLSPDIPSDERTLVGSAGRPDRLPNPIAWSASWEAWHRAANGRDLPAQVSAFCGSFVGGKTTLRRATRGGLRRPPRWDMGVAAGMWRGGGVGARGGGGLGGGGERGGWRHTRRRRATRRLMTPLSSPPSVRLAGGLCGLGGWAGRPGPVPPEASSSLPGPARGRDAAGAGQGPPGSAPAACPAGLASCADGG